MNVRLIGCTHTYNVHAIPEFAAAICVGNEESDNTEKLYKGYQTAIESGHYSILEHVQFSWLVTDVSRSLTQQFITHRIASRSQQSQRHCKVDTTNANWYIIPESIRTTAEAIKQYKKIMNSIATVYNSLLKLGIPTEDARMVLPNACCTKLIISMNARAFIEAAQKRLCNKAQWEIRELFTQMKSEVSGSEYSKLAQLAVPKCATTGCPEKRSCGKPYDKLKIHL